MGCELGFQSTHPSWGATYALSRQKQKEHDFNPRTHRGVRPSHHIAVHLLVVFQSTHPSWGATLVISSLVKGSWISIHAPIVGCDFSSLLSVGSASLFQSTHPSWGATMAIHAVERQRLYFNPRTHRGVRQYLNETGLTHL